MVSSPFNLSWCIISSDMICFRMLWEEGLFTTFGVMTQWIQIQMKVFAEMYLLADLHTLHLQGGLEALSSNWSWLIMRNFSSLDALFQLALKLALDNIMRGTYSSICTGLTTFLWNNHFEASLRKDLTFVSGSMQCLEQILVYMSGKFCHKLGCIL